MKFPIIEPLESRIAPAVLTLALPSGNPKNEGTVLGGKTDFIFTVSLDAAATSVVTVVASTLDGSALGGDGDFDALSQTLTFAVGEVSKDFIVKVNADAKLEGDETFSVKLSSFSAGSTSSVGQVTATILNDDAAPRLSVVDARVVEGNSGTKQLAFTVALSNPSNQAITFDWATAVDGGVNGATVGTDFTGVGTTMVTIPAGATSATLNVDIVGDTTVEADETFFVNITNAKMGGAALVVTKAQAKGTIGNDERTLSLSAGPTVVEGSPVSGVPLVGTNADFTVTLDSVSAYDVTATFSVAGFAAVGGHAATLGTDFTAPSVLTLMIPAGQTSGTFTVPVIKDALHEVDETFKVTLVSATNAAVGAAGEAVGTITDDDAVPKVSVTGGTVTEDTTGDPLHPEIKKSNLDYTIRLDAVSGEDVTVLVSTADGTATTVDLDYDAQSNVLVTIPAGTLQKTFTVKVNHDDKFEGNETVLVNLSGPTGATIGTGTGTGAIMDEDARPMLSIGDLSKNEGNGGTTNFDFTVTLSNPSDQPITFTWATAGATATAGVDYTAVATTTVTIPAGQKTATLSVPVSGDVVAEGDETFLVQINSALMGGSSLPILKGTATGRIINDEVLVNIAGAGNVTEGTPTVGGPAVTTDANFLVSLAGGATDHDVVVAYVVQAGTAKSLTDYTVPTTQTVTIVAGQTSATITVKVNGDRNYEGTESFSVKLLEATTGAAIGTDTGTATILDDDVLPTLSIANVSGVEGNPVVAGGAAKTLDFVVSIPETTDQAITFDWATVGGTATSGVDFAAVGTATATILAGSKSVTIKVTLVGDTVYEGDETVLVNLSNAQLGGTALVFADAQGQGTITNDEANTLTITDKKVSEGNAGTKTLDFTVSLTNAADQDITFDWGTSLGSATVGVDYVAVTSAVGTILAGSTTGTISVTVNGDTTDELDETFFVNLVNAKYGATVLTFARAQALGTIANDEVVVSVAPTLSVAEGHGVGLPNQATFTISLNVATTRDVVVAYAVHDGTALAVSDYVAPMVTMVTIPAGQTSVDVKVGIVGDRVLENAETFTFDLVSASNGTLNGLLSQTVATITNDDVQATLSVGDASITEGNSGTKNLTFTVSLLAPASGAAVAASEDVSFTWATENMAALSGLDFVVSGEQRTIKAGEKSVMISVTILGDMVDESDEFFHVNLSDATIGAAPLVISKAQANGTILNDELAVTITGGSVIEGDSGVKPLEFDLSLNQVSAHDVVVHLAVQAGSTANATDYSILGSLDVTILAGQKSVKVPVQIKGDIANEADETVILKMVSVENATGGGGSATGTIQNDDLPPTVSVAAPSGLINEGSTAGGKTDLVYRVSLSAMSSQAVTVNVSTVDGTATAADGDYVGQSNFDVTIPAGQTFADFTVKVNQDSKYETDETVTVKINSATNATLSTVATAVEATATITNDDTVKPKLSISDVVAYEGSGGGQQAYTFTISLDAASGVPVTFSAATVNGTALADSPAVAANGVAPAVPAVIRDFVANTEAFTFAPGDTVKTFTVMVNKDSAFSVDETFSVSLTGVAGADVQKGKATGTIRNDDAVPTLSIGDLGAFLEGNPTAAVGAVSAVTTKDLKFVVKAVGTAEEDIAFTIKTTDGIGIGGATARNDFTGQMDVVGTILAGSTTGEVKVVQVLDVTDEADESFTVEISAASVSGQTLAITKNQATATLLNDDLTIRIEDVTVLEGATGETDAVFHVKLGAASLHEVTVHYRTVDGTATSTGNGADFTAISDTLLTIPAGQTEGMITVKVHGDVNHDLADNKFQVVLSNPLGARFAKAAVGGADVGTTGVGTITEEATDALPVITLATPALSLKENVAAGKFVFKVTLDHPSDEVTEIFATTVDGTAKAGTDYVGFSLQRIVFAPGEVTKDIEVAVTNDAVFEADESFTLKLSDPLRGTFAVATPTAVGTIENDDARPHLQISGAVVVEGTGGDRLLSFTVQKIGAAEPASAVTFDFATFAGVGDTATAGVDYEALSGHYTMAANETSKVIQVKILGDAVYEDTETFSAKISNVTGADIPFKTGTTTLDDTAKGTITDDDLTVAFDPASVTLTTVEGNLGEHDLVFTVKLSAEPLHDVTVNFAASGLTATAGDDFLLPAGTTVTFKGKTLTTAGEQTAEIRVPIKGDIAPELAETLKVTLSTPAGSGVRLATTLVAASGDVPEHPVNVGDVAMGTITNDDTALSISDVQIVEGNSGAKNMVFTVTLNGASAYPVTVHYATQDGSATATTGTGTSTVIGDYTATTGDLSFAANEVTKTITVPISGDAVAEGDETFNVVLSDAKESNVVVPVILRDTAVGTITNDDVPTFTTSVSITDVSIAEGDSGTSTAIFTVSLSAPSPGGVSVVLTTVDDSAISTGAGADYLAKTETLTFAAGETTKTFSVTILGDRQFEAATEMFKVKLSDAVGTAIARAEGIGNITGSADTAPTLSVGDATLLEGALGDAKMAQFTVTLSELAGFAVTFDAATVAGTATAGTDFTALVAAPFTIPAGQKTFTFSVPILGDAAVEGDETFQVSLSNAKIVTPNTALTFTKALGAGKILNDDLTVSVGDVSQNEGNSGTTQLLIPVTIPAVSTVDVVVNFTVTAVTATAGAGKDFLIPTNLSVTIPAGQTSANISIDVLGDTTDENDETFNVVLTSATNALLGAATTAIGTIKNDDIAPTLTLADVTVIEGRVANFGITLSAASGKDVVVHWITVPVAGGATSGVDFEEHLTAETLTIPAGETTGKIVVRTTNDTTDEVDETFQVRLLSVLENATLSGSGTATGTISANDLSTFSIGNATRYEGNAGTTMLDFIVTRSGSTTLTSTVNFGTADGTALSASDYVAQNGTLTFGPGETAKTISIAINGDGEAEADETFSVLLSTPTLATVIGGPATGTIRNDEVVYRIVKVASFSIAEEGGTFEFQIERVGTAAALAAAGSATFGTAVDDTLNAHKATAGTDYTTTSATVAFPADRDTTPSDALFTQLSSAVQRVEIKSDAAFEGNETFKLKLTSVVNGIISDTDAEKIVTITDATDLALLPKVKIEDATIVEGNSGTKELVFKVKLVAANDTTAATAATAGGPITVKYATTNGTATATAGVVVGDYAKAAADASVTFAAGASEAEIRISLNGDTVDEADETFTVTLSDAQYTLPDGSVPQGIAFADDSATGTITNDDLVVSVTGGLTADEGNTASARTFTVSIPQASTHDVTLHIKTKDGTAISTAANGELADFVALTDTVVTIPAGQTSADFSVTVNGDVYHEADETFTFELSAPTGAILGSTTATATLKDDDAAPSLNIGDVSIVEGDSGQQNLVFTVTLAGATREAVTLDYTTVDGSAKSSGPQVDYVKTSGKLTIPASATGGTQTISVPIFGDQWRELTENFTVELSNVKLGTSTTGVTLTNGSTATGTITDNGDTSLGVFVNDARIVEGGNLMFTVETTAPVTGSDLTFTAIPRSGTAVANDFTTPITSNFKIAAGQSKTDIFIGTTADTVFEKAEDLYLDIKNFSGGAQPIHGTNGLLTARGIILDNDTNIISAREFQYWDVDGDLVDVKFSKSFVSTLTGTNSRIQLTAAGDFGGRTFDLINLTGADRFFSGINISVTSKVQGLPNGERLGDGKTNVLSIEAAVPDAGLYRFASGTNLGKVSISGDLGRVLAGNILRPAGIAQLNVGSLGASSTTANSSLILGPIGKMVVKGDVVGSLNLFGDGFAQSVAGSGFGKIGTLIIKGQLKGGTADGSGQIAFTAGIGSATIGGITGGAGAQSGTLLPLDARYNTGIGKLTVLGNITGGAGASSGLVNVNALGKLTLGKASHGTTAGILASIKGGSGAQSGSIIIGIGIRSATIYGDIVGGSGNESGEISAARTLGKTQITGNILGGSQAAIITQTRTDDTSTSGGIFAGKLTGQLTVEGNIQGGTGANSGFVKVSGITTALQSIPGSAPSITLGKKGTTGKGSIIGGAGDGSGIISIAGSLGSFLSYGNIQGGSGNGSGTLSALGTIQSTTIKGSILGGSTADTDTTDILRTGFIEAGNLGSVLIGGDIKAGKNLGTTLAASGGIYTSGKLGKLEVQGNILGNETTAVILSARNGIGSATFHGSVTFAEILAGYAPPTEATTPRGELENPTASIGTVKVLGDFSASSIVAGAEAGSDDDFGTTDDKGTTTDKLIARIASVILKSVSLPTAAKASGYGIVAEQIGSLKVGAAAIPLLTGPHNDSVAIPDASTKLRVIEV